MEGLDLNLPIWQLTVSQFIELLKQQLPTPVKEKKYERGLGGIMRTLNVSYPTANKIKQSGLIDKAIDQPAGYGGNFTIDVELALNLIKNTRYEKKIKQNGIL